jgi:L-lactate dehydrogenase complex protein LldG
MNARDDILAKLSRATPAIRRPAAAPRTPAPGGVAGKIGRFAAGLEAASATFAVVGEPAALPGAVAGYLAAHALPLRIHLGDVPAAAALRSAAQLEHDTEPLAGDGGILVTGCLAALAEEGVVVLASGPRQPAADVFLAATHIVVVESTQLLDGMDDLWPLLRHEALPRSVHLIRGPSRTADLGVPSRLGAHGPLRLHVILVDPAYVQ